jgi:hypothetical protein
VVERCAVYKHRAARGDFGAFAGELAVRHADKRVPVRVALVDTVSEPWKVGPWPGSYGKCASTRRDAAEC